MIKDSNLSKIIILIITLLFLSSCSQIEQAFQDTFKEEVSEDTIEKTIGERIEEMFEETSTDEDEEVEVLALEKIEDVDAYIDDWGLIYLEEDELVDFLDWEEELLPTDKTRVKERTDQLKEAQRQLEAFNFRENKEALKKAQADLYEFFGTEELYIASYHFFVNEDSVYTGIFNPEKMDEADIYYYTKETMAWESRGPYKLGPDKTYQDQLFLVSEVDLAIGTDIYASLADHIEGFDYETNDISMNASKSREGSVIWHVTVRGERRDYSLEFDNKANLITIEER